MLLVLIKKELKRVFSDRRLVFSAFILPAISIYILYSLMGSMLGDMIGDQKAHVSIVKVYYAPESFKDYLSTSNEASTMEVAYETGDTERYIESLRSGDVDLIVSFGNDFDEQVKDYEEKGLADIAYYYNPSEDYSSVARNKVVYNLLPGYESTLLKERFGDESYAKAFTINASNNMVEIVDEGKAAGIGLSMIVPMLIAVLLFAGAMGIGMDTIAGEKERGTMATLLMTPVPRETIALGKIIGLAIVAIISASSSFLAIILSLPNSGMMLTGGDVSLSALKFSPLMYVQLLVVMLTLVGVYVGLICITSVRAKSVKEAGTYVSPIYMLVMFAAMSTMFQTGDPKIYQFAIPVLGNILSIKRLLTFELLMSEFLVTTTVSVVTAGVLIWLITKSFNNEKVMLNA